MPTLQTYCSGFYVGGTDLTMSATVASAAASVTAGYYIHGYDLAALGSFNAPWNAYSDFATAVKTTFDAATSSSFTVAWSPSTGKYTISRATNFTLTFTGNAGTRLKNALGYTSNKSGSNSYTSDGVPKYVIGAAITALSNVSDVYEPDGLVEESVSDGGDPFGTALRTAELWSDWTQTMESKAATFERISTAPGAWSWESFFKHQRMSHPFITYAPDGLSYAYVLRADGARFKPERLASDLDTYWNIPFRCRDLGVAE